jgi:hypothetical protein
MMSLVWQALHIHGYLYVCIILPKLVYFSRTTMLCIILELFADKRLP